MKFDKQMANWALILSMFLVALYAFFVKCDLIFLFAFQIVWIILMSIVNRKSN